MRKPNEKVSIPLGTGLNQKSDERVLEAPALAVCQNVEFEEHGGLQTRKPFVALDNNTAGITGIRRLATYEGELIAFTEDAIWTYSSVEDGWTEVATHLAIKINERSLFVTTGDQYSCDRAELGGVIFFTWFQATSTGNNGFIAALDANTGAILLLPETIDTSTVSGTKMIVTATKVVLVYKTAAVVAIRTYTPASIDTPTTNSYAHSNALHLDACVDPEDPNDFFIAVPIGLGDYILLHSVDGATPTLITTRSISVTNGPIAIDSNGVDELCVVYNKTTTVFADILQTDGTVVSGEVSMGAPTGGAANHITVKHDASSLYHVFWSGGEITDDTAFETEYSTITELGVAGTPVSLVKRCGLATRAFLRDSFCYVWVTFEGTSSGIITSQLQNTYFLYRHDGLLVSKAVTNEGGGLYAEGFLSNVQQVSTNKYAWAGEFRRIIPLGDTQKGYEAKSPHEITFEFDSNEARRTTQLGKTLYITGGQVMQYDSKNLVELGFHIFPWYMVATVGGTGPLIGTYNWLQTHSWFNAKGEFERSTTATIYEAGVATSDEASLTGMNLHVTLKTGDAGEIANEFWRGVGDAAIGTPFYLVTGRDPASTGDNKWLANDPDGNTLGTLVDAVSDENLISNVPYPEAGGAVLENLSPPSSTIIHSTQDRVLLAGVANHPHRIVYSKLRNPGEVVSFHEALTVELPPDGGAITAIEFLNETLIVFKERAIYALPGDGFDNTGGGANYGPARILANDVGAVSAEAVALTPKGLAFKSLKGWYLLNRGWSAGYIGAPVSDFDGDTVLAVHTVETQHQVRCCTSGRTLCWDYLINQWSEWTTDDITHSVIWGDTQHYASSAGDGGDLKYQDADWLLNLGAYGQEIETAWLKFDGLQGYQRIQELAIIGEYRSAGSLRIQVAYDYDDTWVDDDTWVNTATVVGSPFQMVHNPSRQKCQSIKVRITARNAAGTDYPLGEAVKLSGLQVGYKTKATRNQRLPKGQKQ